MSLSPSVDARSVNLRAHRPARPPAWGLPPSLLTAALCLFVSVAFLSPVVTSWLQFDRGAVDAGQWWRLLTAHVTHWGGEHLLWDLAMFAVLGALCEAGSRMRFTLTVLGSALSIVLAVWLFLPDLVTYRGLSGIDSALFALLAVTMFRRLRAEWNLFGMALVALLAAGFAAKIGYELAAGRAFFVDSASASFTPVPLAHAVGAAVGMIVAVLPLPPEPVKQERKGLGRRGREHVVRPGNTRVAQGTHG